MTVIQIYIAKTIKGLFKAIIDSALVKSAHTSLDDFSNFFFSYSSLTYDLTTLIPLTFSWTLSFKLSYLSSNEINYIAFGLATEEYHNELYEEIKSIHGISDNYKSFDNNYFIEEKGEEKNYPWKNYPNEVSVHTFIRNQIHHRKENGKPTYNDLKNSIDFIRKCLEEEKK